MSQVIRQDVNEEQQDDPRAERVISELMWRADSLPLDLPPIFGMIGARVVEAAGVGVAAQVKVQPSMSGMVILSADDIRELGTFFMGVADEIEANGGTSDDFTSLGEAETKEEVGRITQMLYDKFKDVDDDE